MTPLTSRHASSAFFFHSEAPATGKQELSREALIEWAKKAKIKIKRLEADLATAKDEAAMAKAAVAGPAGLVGTAAADAGVEGNDELVKNVEETANFIVNSFWGAASAATAALQGKEAEGAKAAKDAPSAASAIASGAGAPGGDADKDTVPRHELDAWKDKCTKLSALVKVRLEGGPAAGCRAAPPTSMPTNRRRTSSLRWFSRRRRTWRIVSRISPLPAQPPLPARLQRRPRLQVAQTRRSWRRCRSRWRS